MNDFIDEDLAQALARLEQSFRALGETRDELACSLDTALTELTRQLEDLDGGLDSATVAPSYWAGDGYRVAA